MNDFKHFSNLVAQSAKFMANNYNLFRTQVTKEEMWDTYLSSFPEGTNPIFRERTEHDCQCCKQFIRTFGNVVGIHGDKLVSIWDTTTASFYQEVADAMGSLVRGRPIENVFRHYEARVGNEVTYECTEDGGSRSWHHFYTERLPSRFITIKANMGSELGICKSTKEVFQRGLDSITLEALDTVLELIGNKAIYRGEEFKDSVVAFKKCKQKYIAAVGHQDLYVWDTFMAQPRSATNMKNTVIGTLLMDLSEGMPLEKAVGRYESKVAPENYKRTTALVTQSMIRRAQDTVEDLGLTSALNRRFAVIEDISINDVLFADKAVRPLMQNPFEELASKTPVTDIGKIHTMDIDVDQFMREVLPNIDSMEILMENRHESNLMSVIAPEDPEAGNLFKWDNGFSWAYNGDVTDSIKQRVKAAGGKVDGDLRCSLSWFNHDDLDIHLMQPNGNLIYFSDPRDYGTKGNLDVDMNAGGDRSRKPVENITFPEKKRMTRGMYTLMVHQYTKRETTDVGFEVEIEFENQLWNFAYAKPVKKNQKVTVAEFEYDGENLTMLRSIPHSQTSKEIWGLQTQQFVPVETLMLSPNHWGDQAIGNKHFFFIMKDCFNPEDARGFFNEYLDDRLRNHRKVFEILGSRMKAPVTERQLSGLGFSSTKTNNIIVQTKGDTIRRFKLHF